MNGAARPLATTTLNSSSGIRNAALYASSSIADAEGLAEGPLPDEAQEVADEREDREEHRPARDEPVEQVPSSNDGRSRHGRLPQAARCRGRGQCDGPAPANATRPACPNRLAGSCNPGPNDRVIALQRGPWYKHTMDGRLLGGRYRLLEAHAMGGMASVWRAHDERTGEVVAVKRLHPHLIADEGARERFRREAAAMEAIRHPNVVAVRDAVIDDGRAGPGHGLRRRAVGGRARGRRTCLR